MDCYLVSIPSDETTTPGIEHSFCPHYRSLAQVKKRAEEENMNGISMYASMHRQRVTE